MPESLGGWVDRESGGASAATVFRELSEELTFELRCE